MIAIEQDEPETAAKAGAALPKGATAPRSSVSAVASPLFSMVSTVGVHFGITALQTVQAILLARILAPEGRGEFATAVFYTYIFTFIGMLGTQFSIARRAARMPNDLASLERSAFRVGLLTGTVAMLAVGALSYLALPLDKRYLAPLCIACTLGLPSEHSRHAMIAVDHGSGSFFRYNLVQFVSAALLPGMLLIVWLFRIPSDARLALLTVPVSLLAWGLRCAAGRSGNLLVAGTPPPRTLLREGLPFAFSVTASDLVNRLDALLMLWLASLPVQGLYQAALPVAAVLAVAPTALALFSFNAGARPDGRVTGRRLAMLLAGTLAVQAVMALALAYVAQYLVALLFRPEFSACVPLIYMLLPAQALQGCVLVADGYLRGRNKAAVGVQARLLGAAAMLICIAVTFPQWQALSIPLGASAAAATACLWLLIALIADVAGTPGPRAADLQGGAA